MALTTRGNALNDGGSARQAADKVQGNGSFPNCKRVELTPRNFDRISPRRYPIASPIRREHNYRSNSNRLEFAST
jgi:hypothetical protein